MSRQTARHFTTTKSHMGIGRGSLQHVALRVLDSSACSAVSLLAMMPEAKHLNANQFLKQVILPLEGMGLLHLDRAALTWGTTDLGNAAARKLGPIVDISGAITSRDPREAANDDEGTSKLHANGINPAPCRPRMAMGNADHMPPAKRPGAMDAIALPSRMGNRLHWPDGRITPA